jgi:hypothetical protein
MMAGYPKNCPLRFLATKDPTLPRGGIDFRRSLSYPVISKFTGRLADGLQTPKRGVLLYVAEPNWIIVRDRARVNSNCATCTQVNIKNRCFVAPKRNHGDTTLSLHPLTFDEAITKLAQPRRNGSQAEADSMRAGRLPGPQYRHDLAARSTATAANPRPSASCRPRAGRASPSCSPRRSQTARP